MGRRWSAHARAIFILVCGEYGERSSNRLRRLGYEHQFRGTRRLDGVTHDVCDETDGAFRAFR